MNQQQAAAAWNDIADELSTKLARVRPKLKDYEAHMLVDRARHAVLSAYSTAESTEELRKVAIKALGALSHRWDRL